MFDLKCSHFYDIEEEENIKETSNKSQLNNNLLKVIFDYCDLKDLLTLSLVSKQFNEVVNELSYKFKEYCEINYCSSYSHYE